MLFRNNNCMACVQRLLHICMKHNYGRETYVVRKLDIKRINAIEVKCYSKILRTPYTNLCLYPG